MESLGALVASRERVATALRGPLVWRKLSLVNVFVATLLIAASQGVADPQQSPVPPPLVFGADAGLVLVDATVTDKKGRPVLDLGAADFRVFEDGVERPVTSFAAFGAAATRTLGRPNSADTTSRAPSTPVSFVPASTVLFIDEGHMTIIETASIRKSLTRIVEALQERRGSVLVLAPQANVAYQGRLPENIDLVMEAVLTARGRRFQPTTRQPMTDAEALSIENGDRFVLP